MSSNPGPAIIPLFPKDIAKRHVKNEFSSRNAPLFPTSQGMNGGNHKSIFSDSRAISLHLLRQASHQNLVVTRETYTHEYYH